MNFTDFDTRLFKKIGGKYYHLILDTIASRVKMADGSTVENTLNSTKELANTGLQTANIAISKANEANALALTAQATANMKLNSTGAAQFLAGNGMYAEGEKINLESIRYDYSNVTDVYVETTGDDGNNGLTKATAFKTLEGAINRIYLYRRYGLKRINLGEGTFVYSGMFWNLGEIQILGAGNDKTILNLKEDNPLYVNFSSIEFRDLALNIKSRDSQWACVTGYGRTQFTNCIINILPTNTKYSRFFYVYNSILLLNNTIVDGHNTECTGALFDLMINSSMRTYGTNTFKNFVAEYSTFGMMQECNVVMLQNTVTFTNITTPLKGYLRYNSAFCGTSPFSYIPGATAFYTAEDSVAVNAVN